MADTKTRALTVRFSDLEWEALGAMADEYNLTAGAVARLGVLALAYGGRPRPSMRALATKHDTSADSIRMRLARIMNMDHVQPSLFPGEPDKVGPTDKEELRALVREEVEAALDRSARRKR